VHKAELVVHKAARECPIVEPHPAAMCGIVAARRRAQAAADEPAHGPDDPPPLPPSPPLPPAA
jgi:hypothetical protein